MDLFHPIMHVSIECSRAEPRSVQGTSSILRSHFPMQMPKKYGHPKRATGPYATWIFGIAAALDFGRKILIEPVGLSQVSNKE